VVPGDSPVAEAVLVPGAAGGDVDPGVHVGSTRDRVAGAGSGLGGVAATVVSRSAARPAAVWWAAGGPV